MLLLLPTSEHASPVGLPIMTCVSTSLPVKHSSMYYYLLPLVGTPETATTTTGPRLGMYYYPINMYYYLINM